MKVEIFTLCDAATEHAGKLNVVGVFDTITAPEAPIRHPQCAVAIRLRFDSIEAGEHRFRLDIIDQDGKPVMPPLENPLQVFSHPGGRSSTIAHFIFTMNQLVLPHYGEYEIRLAIDGRSEGSLPLFAAKPPQKAQPKLS